MTPLFQPIGPLLPASPLYIERGAEKEAIRSLCSTDPDFLLITEPRQQGKTSFINYLSRHPALSRCYFLIINAGRLSKQFTEMNWYNLLLSEAQRQLEPYNLLNRSLPSSASQEQWREQMLLIGQAALGQQRLVVVAIDELGRLPPIWRESFLSAVCELRDSRANTPALTAITFLFAGSFRPEAMITDWNVSPFNKAKPLELEDFTPAQVAELLRRAKIGDELVQVLQDRLFYWTDGQPYLVQRLCEVIFSDAPSSLTNEQIDAAVYLLERRDRVHLPPIFEKLFASNRLIQQSERVLDGLEVDFAPASIRWQAELTSLGLIKEQKSTGRCIIRNPIYARAFRRFLLHQREKIAPTNIEGDCAHLIELITIKSKRRRQLELDIANFGMYTPAHMSLELRELDNELAGLREQIRVMNCGTS
jgi:hypothetical protein